MKKITQSKFMNGPFLIMIAASVWAADSLIRAKLTNAIPSTAIVFYEHLFAFAILSPLFIKSFKKFKQLTRKDWALLLLLTIVSSVLGTVLFTESFARSAITFDFATPVLLLKLQPAFVVTLSVIFLREKVNIKFIGLALLATIGSYMISFGTEKIPIELEGKQLIFILAIGAAFCWGAGTILSKTVLKKLTYFEATVLRFMLAIPVSFLFMIAMKDTYSPLDLDINQVLRFLFIAISTGAVSILIYYKGLQKTPARISTIAELAFPVVSILIAITSLNPFGSPQTLSLANIFGIVILLISILLISFDYGKKETKEK